VLLLLLEMLLQTDYGNLKNIGFMFLAGIMISNLFQQFGQSLGTAIDNFMSVTALSRFTSSKVKIF
jgi:hypothetical protein